MEMIWKNLLKRIGRFVYILYCVCVYFVYSKKIILFFFFRCRFVPDKEFSGTDRSTTRSGPIQFEKDEEDPFGLDQFLKQAKHATSSTSTTTKRKEDRDQRRDDREKRRKH